MMRVMMVDGEHRVHSVAHSRPGVQPSPRSRYTSPSLPNAR
jgi:hypothetical protein